MINTIKIRERIIEKGINTKTLATKILCSPNKLDKKISNLTPMQIEEIVILANELEIPDDEITQYFFS